MVSTTKWPCILRRTWQPVTGLSLEGFSLIDNSEKVGCLPPKDRVGAPTNRNGRCQETGIGTGFEGGLASRSGSGEVSAQQITNGQGERRGPEFHDSALSSNRQVAGSEQRIAGPPCCLLLAACSESLAVHTSLFREKARPDPVFKYRSNAMAFAVSVKAM